MLRIAQPTEAVAQQLAGLPDSPGVYIFRDVQTEIIYIGKALSLRTRVRSYWSATSWAGRPKLAVLVPRVDSIETIVTNSEKEALLLESTLVRQHMPRYNVHLKDDKRYPWLAITYHESFPRLIMIRDPHKYRKEHPKDKIFGPYVETGLMWETVRILRKVFPMRQRRTPLFKDRPCMNFDIGLCLGPCQKLVEEDFYMHMVQQVELFLSGSQSHAVSAMEKEMSEASEALRYEEAARIRDRIVALRSVMGRQQVMFQDKSICLDVIAQAHTDKVVMICLMRIREGKLVGSEIFDMPLTDKTTFDEAYQSFIEQYFTECEIISIPREILLQHKIDDEEVLAQALSVRADRVVKVSVPVRGDKLRMIEMAQKNASHALEQQLRDLESASAASLELLTKLQEELELSRPPVRIECFDISHFQGTDQVASMVCFENGKSKKSDYRTFKIKSVLDGPDDFASMKEVVGRRYKRLKEENKPMPDLIIIDGGKGQLNAAIDALKELELFGQMDILGLAKRQEEVFKPGKSDPLLLSRRSEALLLLQRTRDEAHRFAITFHRKLRAKRSLMSGFDQLPNVGEARRRLLMMKFGTFERLTLASLEDLKSVPKIPEKVAEAIYNHLHGTGAGEDTEDRELLEAAEKS